MSAMKCIYIAGPIRAISDSGLPNDLQRQKNIMAAAEWNAFIWNNGGVAICPHTNNMWLSGSVHRDVILKGDLELLRKCDAILLLPGWRDSVGSRGEFDEATYLGLATFDFDFPEYFGSVRQSMIEALTEKLCDYLNCVEQSTLARSITNE